MEMTHGHDQEWLENQMKLYCTHFNFCRGHGGLRYKDERGLSAKIHPQEEQELLSHNEL